MISKGGVTQMTVTKLITYILLIAVMVLVLYGVVNGGFTPLIERASGLFDDVMILLGFGGSDPGVACYLIEDGITWKEGVSPLMGRICISKKECKVELDSKVGVSPISYPLSSSFSLVGSSMKHWIPSGSSGFWGNVLDGYRVEDAKVALFDREIYLALSSTKGIDIVTLGRASVNPYLLGGLYFRVTHWGKDSYFRRDYDGTWYSGAIEHNVPISKKDWNDEVALTKIYENAGWTNEVYWKFRDDVSSEALLPGMIGDAGQIDSAADFEIFKKFFRENLKIVESRAEAKIEEARHNLLNKNITFREKEYAVQMGNFSGRPMFFIEGEFGLYGAANSLVENRIDLVVEKSGKWSLSRTPTYFLDAETDDKADSLIKLNAIYNFLKSKC